MWHTVTVNADLNAFAIPALVASGYGDRLRPLDGKRLAIKERGPLTPAELVEFMRRGFNLGMRLWDGLMVVDKDGENLGAFAELSSPMTVKTSRGTHSYFRTEQERSNLLHPGGLDVDVLFHGVTVLPPSLHPTTGWRYGWERGLVKKEDLPLFPVELLPAEAPRAPTIPVNALALPPDEKLDRMRKYIRKAFAVQGEGGDRTTFRVCCRIVEVCRDFTHCWRWNGRRSRASSD